ncbi:MAG: tetratricopeptide repeat protein [Capsulimonadales bacterium]|nr:tetratricopeptide repeat protein [Capsulimonadales bacterium]
MPLWGRMFNRSGRSQHYDRGIRLFDQGLYEQAIDEFKQALSEARGGALVERLARFYLAESYSALAQSQMTRPATSRAIENLQAAIAISPNYADLHYHLGVAYLNRSQMDDALDCFRNALEINPAYARALLQYGIALYLKGSYEEGLQAAEQAADLDPVLPRKFVEDARRADAENDRDGVVARLRRMVESEGDEAMYHARLALDLFRRGMLTEAIEEYRQALEIAPNYADLRNQLGVTLYAAGRDEEAIVEFNHALSINPRYVEARLNHGLALQRQGFPAQAHAEFCHVLELDPDNQMAAEALNQTRAAAA